MDTSRLDGGSQVVDVSHEDPGSSETELPLRTPGRPPGSPKTGGRQKGVPNKVTREIRDVAGKYTLRILKQIWKLAQHAESEEVRLKAQALMLAYGHGKPTERRELSGADGAPIESRVTAGNLDPTADAAKRLAFAMARINAAAGISLEVHPHIHSSSQPNPVTIEQTTMAPVDPLRHPDNQRSDNRV